MQDEGKTDLHTGDQTEPADTERTSEPSSGSEKPAKHQTSDMQADDRSNKPVNSDG